MTDRELLEAAAKAAGMEGCAVQYADRLVFLEDGKPASLEWTPLQDDGDALRLAVKLRISVTMSEYGRVVCRAKEWSRSIQPYGDDAAAATRLAIVEAAAALAPQPAEVK